MAKKKAGKGKSKPTTKGKAKSNTSAGSRKPKETVSKSKAKSTTSHETKSASETVKNGRANITKNMTLGELVTKHPETVEVMFKYGLHCVGCHMAAHETIEQGAMAHGMDSKAIEKMLKEMNEATK